MATLTDARPETAVVERGARAGQMTPLYSRNQIETYHVVEGEVTFYVGDDVIRATPGDIVVAPAGSARTMRAETGARWLVLTRVSEIDRYVDFGRAVAEPQPNASFLWSSAEDYDNLAGIAAVNGMRLLGPPGALPGAG